MGYLEADTDTMHQTNRVGRIVRALRNSLRKKVTKEIDG